MGIGDLVEVLRNLNLHIVRDALVLLNTREELVELLRIALAEKLAHHAEHTLDALGERLYLLGSLQHRQLRGLHDARLYEVQTEFVLVFVGLRLDDLADELLQVLDRSDEDERVRDIERRMEGGQHEAQLGGVGGKAGGGLRHIDIVAYPAADHVDERMEDAQHPDDAEDVEHHVRHRRPPGLRVGSQCSEVRRDRRTDVLAQHQCDALVNRQHAGGTENHRDGHDGGRTLHAHCQNTADEQEHYRREETSGVELAEEVEHSLVVCQVHVDARLAQCSQSEEHERDAEEEVADELAFLGVDQDYADKEGRPHKVGDVEREAGRHDPCRQCRADVGTHDD